MHTSIPFFTSTNTSHFVPSSQMTKCVSLTPLSVTHKGVSLPGRPVAAIGPYETLWVYYPKGATYETHPTSIRILKYSCIDGRLLGVTARITLPGKLHFVRYLGRIGGVIYLAAAVGRDCNHYSMCAVELDTLELRFLGPLPDGKVKGGAEEDLFFSFQKSLSTVMDWQLVLLGSDAVARYDPEIRQWSIDAMPLSANGHSRAGPDTFDCYLTAAVGNEFVVLGERETGTYTTKDGYNGVRVWDDRHLRWEYYRSVYPYEDLRTACIDTIHECMYGCVSGRHIVAPFLCPSVRGRLAYD
ncbi:hypothetical protein KIPB_001949 [Kipferlia bialata]|uniref:Uncharacterized protein n=1 Tax=Kipferlia bialata TaxID=797122 RepID=A0A9K3CRC5_9EUKA|nr:hypothetical protein KIPB_001949 [Kipferlia bialata]|eukprot:g1949.t1